MDLKQPNKTRTTGAGADKLQAPENGAWSRVETVFTQTPEGLEILKALQGAQPTKAAKAAQWVIDALRLECDSGELRRVLGKVPTINAALGFSPEALRALRNGGQ